MNRLALALTATLLITPALITQALAQRQEPVGCDKFKWPLEHERALLTAPDAVKMASGADIALPAAKAVVIQLRPLADAQLPTPPERAPRSDDGKAGFVNVSAPAQPGAYRITLSAGGWIDMVQDGHFIKSGEFSGATGCEGVRKSVTFDLAAKPFVLQFSSVPADAIGIVITPVKP
jgi:hypothetical protein